VCWDRLRALSEPRGAQLPPAEEVEAPKVVEAARPINVARMLELAKPREVVAEEQPPLSKVKRKLRKALAAGKKKKSKKRKRGGNSSSAADGEGELTAVEDGRAAGGPPAEGDDDQDGSSEMGSAVDGESDGDGQEGTDSPGQGDADAKADSDDAVVTPSTTASTLVGSLAVSEAGSRPCSQKTTRNVQKPAVSRSKSVGAAARSLPEVKAPANVHWRRLSPKPPVEASGSTRMASPPGRCLVAVPIQNMVMTLESGLQGVGMSRPPLPAARPPRQQPSSGPASQASSRSVSQSAAIRATDLRSALSPMQLPTRGSNWPPTSRPPPVPPTLMTAGNRASSPPLPNHDEDVTQMFLQAGDSLPTRSMGVAHLGGDEDIFGF